MVESTNDNVESVEPKVLTLKEQAALRGPPTSQWVTKPDATAAPAKAPVKKKRRPVMKLLITDNHGEQPAAIGDGQTQVGAAQ